jgi:uncharacterized protein (DUF58 family)
MLYPRFDELIALKSKASSLSLFSNQVVISPTAGDFHSPFRGQGLAFEEVRPYVPGDDIRNIDWRVTARTGAAHTKVFRQERERSVLLCIDVNAAMRFGTQGTFKSIQAARVAALLGWRANMNHDKIGAYLFGDVPGGRRFLAPNRSRKSLLLLFKQLSDTNLSENAPHISLEETLPLINKAAPTGALVYIMSDFSTMSETLEQPLSSLRKRCNVVLIPIDDPMDQHIPPIGPLLFTGQNKEKLYVNTDSNSGRKAYATQWQQVRETLQQIARKLNINIISIATNADAQAALFYGLKRTKRGRR